MERLTRDLRYAARRLLKKPVFTGTAIVSLAIGIGANTAIFSIVNAVILRDLPFEAPEELVDVYRSVAGFSHAPLSFPDIEDLRRESAEVFRDVAGARMSFIQTDIEGGVEMIPAELVTGSYFPLLGVPAHIGRTLLPEDDVSPGGHFGVMLDYSYWQRRYGEDPGVVGQEIRLNGRAYTIVRVGPKQYTGNLPGLGPQIYASTMMVGHLNPSTTDELQARNNQSTFVKARLLPGVTLAQASAVTDRLDG